MSDFKIEGKRRLGFLIFFVLFSAFLSTQIIIHSTKTFEKNGHWLSGKLLLASSIGLMGSNFFASDRVSLNGESLHLGAWHGYQEVIYARPIEPQEITANLTLEKDGYVYILYSTTDFEFSGVRLSRNLKFPGAALEVDSDDHFRVVNPIDGLQISKDSVQLKLKFTGESVSVFVDELLATTLRSGSLTSKTLRLRGGKIDASFKNIVILEKGETSFEDFVSPFEYRLFFGFVTLYWLFACVLIFRKSVNEQLKFFKIMALCFTWLVCLFFYDLVDKNIWAGSYHQAGYLPGGEFESNIGVTYEKSRVLFFEGIRQALEKIHLIKPLVLGANFAQTPWVSRQVQRQAQDQKYFQVYEHVLSVSDDSVFVVKSPDEVKLHNFDAAKNRRVLWLGSSQTWGAGASSRFASFPSLAVRNLQKEMGVKFSYLNLATCSNRSGDQLKELRKYISVWQPHFIIVNLSSNDGRASVLAENLVEMWRIAKDRGAKMIFVLEPNSLEFLEVENANHLAMLELGRKLKVPVIALNQYINGPSVYDSGFIWWDLVHMAHYGHKVTGEWLAQELIKYIK